MQDFDRNPSRNPHRNNNGRHSRKPPASDKPIVMGTEFVEGTVKFYNTRKGFGFIKVDGGRDVYISEASLDQSGLQSLDDGRRVRFLIGPGEKGHESQPTAYQIGIARR